MPLRKTTYIFLILSIAFVSCERRNIKKNGCKSDALWFNNGVGSFTYPNVFTPNGDGINDLFNCSFGGSYDNFSLKIFDGNKTIFKTTDPEVCWDGTNEGNDVSEGIYNYHLVADIGGDHLDYERSITLIRDVGEVRIEGCENCQFITNEPICGF